MPIAWNVSLAVRFLVVALHAFQLNEQTDLACVFEDDGSDTIKWDKRTTRCRVRGEQCRLFVFHGECALLWKAYLPSLAKFKRCCFERLSRLARSFFPSRRESFSPHGHCRRRRVPVFFAPHVSLPRPKRRKHPKTNVLNPCTCYPIKVCLIFSFD